MKRLKILFVPGWYPSGSNPVKGVFVREHAKAVSLYDDVAVLLHEEGPTRGRRPFCIRSDGLEHGIRTVRLNISSSPLPFTTWPLHLAAMLHGFSRLASSGFFPDVIHGHIFWACVVPILMGWLYRIPVVVTEHSSAFALRTLTRIGVLEARFAMRRAKMVMPVSNALREHIEACRIRGRFAVVPNAVDTTAFYAGQGTPEPPHPGGQRRLVTVALLTPVKGIPLLLQALRLLRERVPAVELDIVGDGPNRSEYQELSASLGLSDFVHFWGLRSKDEVAVFMRRADVFVLASVTENLPCAVLEAMCCGLPIVATRVGGLPEVVTADRGRLVISRRPDDLAGAIEEVLRSRTAYSRREIAGYARQTFSYEAVGRRLDNIYRSVLK